MWVVYVLKQSETSQIYIGFTHNLQQRLVSHNRGTTKATRRKSGVWELVYAEAYRSKLDAVKRERMLKHHGSSKRKLFDRIQRSLLGG